MTVATEEGRRPRHAHAPRSVLGMPGPVLTLAVWLGVVAGLLAVSLLAAPHDDDGSGPVQTARLVGLLYSAAAAISLLVLGARTPRWYLYLQMTMVVALGLWRTAASPTPLGVVTSSIGIVVVATYGGSWMPLRPAVGYVLATAAGLLAIVVSKGAQPQLLLPWIVLVVMALGIVATLGHAVRQLQRQAVTDPLTGLLNRAALYRLVESGRGPGRVLRPLHVMVLDLDGFKAVNDGRGDAVLRDFADAVRDVLRADDVAVRSGGDEFLLLLPQTDEAGARAVAERLRAACATTWSYGLSEWGADEEFDAVMARADAAMYEDKQRRHRRPPA